MNGRSFLITLVLALLLQLSLVRMVPALAGRLDFLLVVVILNALGGNSLAGLAGGLLCGLLSDALSGQLYGFYGFADTIVGYSAARIAQLLVTQRPAGLVLLSTGAAALQQVVLALLSLALVPDPELPPPASVAFLMVATGALGPLFWHSLRRLRERWERGRQSSTLRL